MQKTWGPTPYGKTFTKTLDWSFSLKDEKFQLSVDNKRIEGDALELEGLRITPGFFWSSVTIPYLKAHRLSLDGIPNNAAKEMGQAVEKAAKRMRVIQLLQGFNAVIQPVVKWATNVKAACKVQLASKGWLTREFKAKYDAEKPQGLLQFLSEPEIALHINGQPKEVIDSITLWRLNLSNFTDDLNERHLEKELREFKTFFDQVEKSPLTEEQAKAVVCFDNRVLLVASAGSGKTSTMVAKAGYALKKGYFEADKMLLLAFNKDAATELQERIKARLKPLGLPADKIVAKTFHAFGLDIIGEATGKKPSVAPWLESGRDLDALLELVDDLKDHDVVFRTNWDLFRIVLGQDLPQFGKEEDSPDSWDRERQTEGFWTLNGETVKSRGEQVIANWLFYNGVQYQYESPYPIETADAKHRQYRPDFYFPDVDAYLEHWAVDEHGNPPPEFTGYKEGMAWKRKLHTDQGTKLLETTMAELWSGKAFNYLSQELTRLGITLDPNPERPVAGRKPIENPRLARTFRSFLTHAKSNRLSVAALRQRLNSGVAGRFHFRHQMFLDLFEKVWAAWEARLAKDQCIDFEDMLGQAADCVEKGSWKSPYELVMVDEFQDVSQARARLVASLLKEPSRYLFAVGDDWQSINRFAGSDLAVMTDFEKQFGKAVTLKLETTFRCPQSLCDISSTFVQKNPKQLKKKVRSAKPNLPDPIRIIQVDDETKIRNAIARRISEIAEAAKASGERPRIYILGRYHKEREHIPLRMDETNVEVEFITAHSSKGLEADHVILPRITSETLGFPSGIVDDPVLQLAMPSGDSFEYAEERRLFYVALTRARSTVTLITLAHSKSPFIAELVREHKLNIFTIDGVDTSSQVCPTCREGFLVSRRGPYGPFLGCSRYPLCKHTKNIRAHSRQAFHRTQH